MRNRLNEFLDEVHDRTCGSDSLWFRAVRPFLVDCPCCSFYRGLGIGVVVTGVVTWLV